MEPLSIEGSWVFSPAIHADSRGSFLEWFRGGEIAGDLGYHFDTQQANCSVSRRGVVRGVHFSDVPPGQAKYVTCVSGAILDVVVDVRCGSPSYGRWESVRLDDETRQAVFLCEGLGHAFLALSDTATVVYLCSTPYAPQREHGVHPLDAALGIAWPRDMEIVPSQRDSCAPSLAEARSAGLLPDYQACEALVRRQVQPPLVAASPVDGLGQAIP
jgi:dTDP-4-dehydrorhamnose 3,5-epimerase